MIKKAVYTHWDSGQTATNGGFKTERDLIITLTLSLEKAKEQFEEVELVTNERGYRLLIEKYGLPFTSIKFFPSYFDDLNPDFWAFAKIYSYSIQEEPFLHIDTDVLLLNKIPEEKLSAPFLFQNKENFSIHKSYIHFIDEAKGFKVNREVINSPVQWAMQCGIVGSSDLETIKYWFDTAYEYIFSEVNKNKWEKIKDKHSHNHIMEQFLISAIIHNKKIEYETLLGDDFMSDANKVGYTHLWGETKRIPTIMEKVKRRLYKDYPQYKEKYEVPKTHSEIFSDILRNESWGEGQGSGGGSSVEITVGYRIFLQNFLKEKKIETVLDFGAGDWRFSKLINWEGIGYLGLDVVEKIVEENNKTFGSDNIKFLLVDEIEDIKDYTSDLLIVKDVLIHWTNEEITNFLNIVKELNFKYILITTQVEDINNKNIETGEYHAVHLNQSPFNIGAEEIYKWDTDNKVTFLC